MIMIFMRIFPDRGIVARRKTFARLYGPVTDGSARIGFSFLRKNAKKTKQKNNNFTKCRRRRMASQ